jgi:hypothetical protein
MEAIRSTLDRVRRLEAFVLSTTRIPYDETTFIINDGVARNLDYVPDHGLHQLFV